MEPSYIFLRFGPTLFTYVTLWNPRTIWHQSALGPLDSLRTPNSKYFVNFISD